MKDNATMEVLSLNDSSNGRIKASGGTFPSWSAEIVCSQASELGSA